jgi:hypothetical protein
MKPFIFQFKEYPIEEPLDYSMIEYSTSLNLSIDKRTGRPAIGEFNMQTETFTKTNGEQTDSDNNYNMTSLETETMTFLNNESSDSDKNTLSIQALLDTTTATRSIESSDQDRY